LEQRGEDGKSPKSILKNKTTPRRDIEANTES
jgi:hypothetical protein